MNPGLLASIRLGGVFDCDVRARRAGQLLNELPFPHIDFPHRRLIWDSAPASSRSVNGLTCTHELCRG